LAEVRSAEKWLRSDPVPATTVKVEQSLTPIPPMVKPVLDGHDGFPESMAWKALLQRSAVIIRLQSLGVPIFKKMFTSSLWLLLPIAPIQVIPEYGFISNGIEAHTVSTTWSASATLKVEPQTMSFDEGDFVAQRSSVIDIV
jgi:hypothetical protein